MKRSLVLPVVLASGCALTVAAQTPAAPMPSAPVAAGTTQPSQVGPAKIAVIAFQVAVSQTNEFQRNFADLQKKYEPKRQELKTMSDEIDRLTKDLQTQGEKLPAAEQASRARTLDEKKKQFERQQQDAQHDFQSEMQDLFSNTASKVYDVLSSYAQKNGYTLVLDIASKQTPVMFAVPSTDITKPVIEAYNVKSGVPAPPAPATGSPAPPTPSTGKPATAKPAPVKPNGH